MHVFLNGLNPVFLVLVYQRHPLIGTMKHIIANNSKYGELLLSCDVCEAKIIISVRKIVTNTIT